MSKAQYRFTEGAAEIGVVLDDEDEIRIERASWNDYTGNNCQNSISFNKREWVRIRAFLDAVTQ